MRLPFARPAYVLSTTGVCAILCALLPGAPRATEAGEAANRPRRKAASAPQAKIAPGLEWLQRERLRGTLFHQPIVGPLAPVYLQAELAAAPDGQAAVTLRGEHYLSLLVDKPGDVSFQLETLWAHELCPMSVFVLFGPDGETVTGGQVEAGKNSRVRIPDAKPGRYILQINSGIASRNVARVSISGLPWAIEGSTRQTYQQTPLTYFFLCELKMAGFNLAMLDVETLPQVFSTGQGLAEWTEAVEAWADQARRYEIRFMPAINLGGTATEVEAWGDAPKGLYIREVPDKPLAPCPLSRVWWERVFLRRAREVARLSKWNPPVVGIAIDPEMYQCWEYGHYMLSGACFCDDCFGGFLRAQKLDMNLLRQLTDGASRHAWLESQKLTRAFDARQEDEMARLAASLRDDLQAINPEFLICVYVLDTGNWFCRGLARGFGSPNVPVVNFSEHTYYGVGCDPAYVAKTQKAFASWGAHVAAGYAVWDVYFPPTLRAYLAAHCYNLAWKGDGYWFWPGCDLMTGAGGANRWVYEGKAATPPDYWLALRDANTEIDRRIAAGAEYVSPLDDVQKVPWQDAYVEKEVKWKEWSGVTPRNDKEGEYPIRLAAPCALQFFAPERAGSFAIRARAQGGEGSLKVLSPDQEVVREERCPAQEDIRLDIERTANNKPGLWTLEATPPAEGQGDLALDLQGIPAYLSPRGAGVLAPRVKAGDILGLWRFDEGRGAVAADSGGEPAYDGRIYNAEWAQGRAGQALSFDGKHSSVRVPHTWAMDNLDQFTLSAWVNLRSLPTKGHGFTIVGKGPEEPTQHFWWWIGYDHYLALEVGSSRHEWGTSFETRRLEWELGRWYHVAVTFQCDGKNSTAALYRDGQRLSTSAKKEAFHSGAYDLLIGAYHGGAIHIFDGRIDEVAFYNRSLTPDEIAGLATSEAP